MHRVQERFVTSSIILAVLSLTPLVESRTQVRPPDGDSSVRITVPAWAQDARCLVWRQREIVADKRGRVQTFRCPANDEVVRCDFLGAEPIDLPLDRLCDIGSLAIQRAEAAVIATGGPVDLTIDWLQFDGSGPVTVIASRRAASNGRLSVPVARLDGRFIRFRRESASPLTLRADSLFDSTLPAPTPGGEIIARIEPASVQPALYRLLGAASSDITPETPDMLLRSGLPPGAYSIVPVYPGGLAGRRISVLVAEGESTALLLEREAVGAVDVVVDLMTCLETDQLLVTRVSSGGPGVVKKIPVRSTN